jgi:hypothetical protein
MELTIATSYSELALAIGAVGTAAMGIAEGFKSVKLTPLGFKKLEEEIGWASESLAVSYGRNYRQLLMSLYRNDRRKGELPRVLRQAVRIGMNSKTAKTMAQVVGGCDAKTLSAVAEKVTEGETLDDTERNILGRFEIAADARIDAAFALAERAYANSIRFRASLVALTLSFVAAIALKQSPDGFFTAFIVGIIAVPFAPIAKDVAKGFQSAVMAIGGGK